MESSLLDMADFIITGVPFKKKKNLVTSRVRPSYYESWGLDTFTDAVFSPSEWNPGVFSILGCFLRQASSARLQRGSDLTLNSTRQQEANKICLVFWVASFLLSMRGAWLSLEEEPEQKDRAAVA